MTYCKTWIVIFAVLISGCVHVEPLNEASQIIDVHRHGTWPESDDAPYRNKILAEMDENGVGIAVISLTDYDDIENWKDVAPDRFVAGVMVPCPRNTAEPYYKCFPSSEGWVDIEWLRTQVENGKIETLFEIGPNYMGIPINDPKLDPYLALAAEFNLPIGVHTQRGPPPRAVNSTRGDPNCCPDYNAEMGNPDLLRPVLETYPGLRVWMQHIGAGRAGGYEPFWEETLGILADYPNVNVDLSITNGPLPIEIYDKALRTLIDAGFGDRIMFGTDNLPTALVLGRLNSIDWLTPDQRAAILYKNAERFFGIKR